MKQIQELNMANTYLPEGFGSNESGAEFGSGNIPGVEVCKLISLWSSVKSKYRLS